MKRDLFTCEKRPMRLILEIEIEIDSKCDWLHVGHSCRDETFAALLLEFVSLHTSIGLFLYVNWSLCNC